MKSEGQQAAGSSSLATVEINGGLYEVARGFGETAWRGELHGEDAETGARWVMPFWLPDAAVAELAVPA